jgi:type I restriction enzyme R subunit
MAFNENSRVKIPAILHLRKLGFTYCSLSQTEWDQKTNICTPIFFEALQRLNPDKEQAELRRTLEDITLDLDNKDLGEAFYKRLTNASGVKLIDFANFDNNSFHVVTELTYKNGDDEFRPDITLLLNGMPLAFIEVKKPNNPDGVLAERDRINVRVKNEKFRRFINITQILVFSNNMEYDTESIEPIQGAFYATTSYSNVTFHCFREEEHPQLDTVLLPEDAAIEDAAIEDFVLRDNNLVSIKYSPEFVTNKSPETPTNRLLTSLFRKDRLAMLLRYCIAFVRETSGIEKHIMRYPQLFATKAIEKAVANNVRKGIVWHTQGSGKTALAYYNVKYLTDYFQAKNIVPKFYFIVDRLDLLDQAKREFTARGLTVHLVNSKDELVNSFRLRQALHNASGNREITVVNIQKFKDDTDDVRTGDYDLNTQRIYFLDEVHRSYNPQGSFFANLVNSDRSAVLIGLTGTPLIGNDRNSRATFGDYLHKYYYNASIADGYTLRLLRENITTEYSLQLKEALKQVQVQQGDVDKRLLYAHATFTEPMLDYIVEDFIKTRTRFGDDTIGAMVVCDSADQARKLYQIFINKYNLVQQRLEEVEGFTPKLAQVPDYDRYVTQHKTSFTASLILHDVGAKEERKQEIEDFKDGKIDLLFVYNMLLTGFDAKRLKKLYLGRIIKDHNLLQTLTRVNRPYKKFRYGFVVDFADISKEFDKTNKAYFDELQSELGDEMQYYSNLFKSKEEIEQELRDITEQLFQFDIANAEIFSQQISAIDDRAKMLEIKKALANARNLYNLIRLYGHFDMLEKVDFQQLNRLYNEAARHLDLLNLKEAVQNETDTVHLLNVALEDVFFLFRKSSEEEMIIADELKSTLRTTREALANNFDKDDPAFVGLYDELKRLFTKKNLDEVSQEEMRRNIRELEELRKKIHELNRTNALLKAKYTGDVKYARVHKRIRERGSIAQHESELCDALTAVKREADNTVLANQNILGNESYFGGMIQRTVITTFADTPVKLTPDSAQFVKNCVVREYMNEYKGEPQ